MEAERRGDRSRRNIVCAAEGRKEIVEGFFVRQINDRQSGAPLIPVAVERVVMPKVPPHDFHIGGQEGTVDGLDAKVSGING